MTYNASHYPDPTAGAAMARCGKSRNGKGAGKISPRYPTEAQEQAALFQWAELVQGRYPDIKWLYHVPNGGSRHPAEARNLKKQGVKPGVPDVCLPVPRGKYHGLYIEMKRIGGTKTPEQKEWMTGLAKQGYRVECCMGFDPAKRAIEEYLRIEEV